MDITKTRLKQIIMEEIQSNLTNEDQGQFLRGASGESDESLTKKDLARIVHEETIKAIKEGVAHMDGETIVTGPDGDASPLARAGARQDDLQTTMMKAAMEIKDNKPQQAYETLLRALAAAGIEDKERMPGLGDELEEGAPSDRDQEINQLMIRNRFTRPQATAIVDGTPEQRANFERLSKKYNRSFAHKHVYGGR
jgi:hypothetical protein